jgi:hypothetical protein
MAHERRYLPGRLSSILALLSAASASAQFTAAPGSPFAVGTVPQAIAAVDLNGDGKLDLVVVNSGGNSVTVLLGNGSNGFSPAPGSPLAVGTNPQAVAVGDFNGDGKPDLAIANAGGNNVTVLLGTGTGRFNAAPGSPFAVGASPAAIISGDFNADGRADIVIANSGDGTITVLLGNGSGGFTPAPGSPVAVGASPRALASGDFNGDRKLDLAAANSSGNTVTIMLGTGGGGFAPAPNSPFSVGAAPLALAVRDLNGDGNSDIVTANSADNTLTELLGDGAGGFTQAASSPFSTGGQPRSVAIADVNADGVLDLIAANSGGRSLTVLLGNLAGGFTQAPSSPFALGTLPVALAAGDFNGDGKPDIAAVNSGDGTVTLYQNTLPALTANPASLTFYAVAGTAPPPAIPVNVSSTAAGSTYTASSIQAWLVPTPASNATGATSRVSLTAGLASLAAGVYGGIVRFAAPNWFDAATAVTLNVAEPSGTLQPAGGSPFPAGAGPQSVAVADFNHDGNQDILTANNADNTATLLLGNGIGGFTAAPGSPFSTGTSPASVAAGDVNGDGKPDILTANSGSNNLTVLLGDGSGGFAPAGGSPFAVGTEPLSVAVGDFNGDGRLDAVVANYTDKNVTILLGDGTGGFTQAAGSPINVGTAPQAVAVGDFNGDGIPDIVEAAFNGRVTILIGNGTGGFAVTQSYAVGSFPQFVVAADLNGDGKLDIVTANFGSNSLSVLLGNGSGGFTAAAKSPFAVGMQPQSVTVADVNGDGKPDLISANTSDNTVSILLGDGSGGFAAAPGSPFAAGAAPFAVAVADFNGDGLPDVAAANAVGTVTVLLGAPVATTSALTTTAGASVSFGTAIPLTLNVTQPSGGFNTPTGSATFQDGGAGLGAAAQRTTPYSLSVTGLQPGTHSFTAAYAGDGANLASASNTVTVVVTAAAQTIAFGALANKVFGSAPFTVTATASSGLPVSFASTTGAVCSVSNGTVTLLAAGACTIQATQGGNTNFAPAPSVSQHFTVAQASQTITFGALPNAQSGTTPPPLSATASSGLAVSFTASPATVCTVSGATLTLPAVGTCTVQANQPGDANYAAAPAVSQHFTVTPTGQTITFGALADQTFGSPPPTLTATASSGLPVVFSSTTSSVCAVSGTTVTLASVGTCTIQAAQAGNGAFAAATPVSQSFRVNQGTQTIAFGALASKAIGAHFTVSATASSGLAVSFASTTALVCTAAGTAVTVVATGTCTIEATQAGNANYAAAAPVDQSFQTTAGPQTIAFGALATRALGGAAFTVSATASSGLPVAFASTTAFVCTVAGASVTLASAGTCTIEATQPGNANWLAAAPVDQSFTVTPGSQTITFGALPSQPLGSGPIVLTATASSGLPVSFTSTTPAVCTVAGTAVTLIAAGACTIQATQAGNGNYAAAPSVTQHFTVTPSGQSITFGALSDQVFGVPPFQVMATASSGLPVGFTSTTASICTVSGTTVTLVGAGTCTIQAAQAGNSTYAAATPVSQSFRVIQGSQTIAFGALAGKTLGSAHFSVSATASSGLPVTFVSTTAAVCTVSAASVTLVSPGTCTIEAQQPGNANYAPAAPVDQSFPVTGGVQTITFGALGSKALGSAAFTVNATASSGLPVSFASTTAAVCTVAGASVTLLSAGSCTIEASQAGNSSWPAATPVDQSFTVTRGSQTIAFAAIPSQPFSNGPLVLSATVTSGLTIVFTSSTPGVCTVAGAVVTFLSLGMCTIQAAQPGDSNYTAATSVTQKFSITQGSQTIAFAALQNQLFGIAPFAVTATASSGLPVSLTSTTTPVCTLSGAMVTLVGVGTCTIQAAQPGNTNYTAAPSVSQSFIVTQASQTITFAALASRMLGPPFTVTAAASSGLPVGFASITPAVCTVSGAAVTSVSLGLCTIEASQAGNANYTAATPVDQSFTLTPGTQTIAFAAIGNQSLGSPPLPLNATATSGLPVGFVSFTTSVCTVSGANANLLTIGTCTIEASQAGNGSWPAAPPVDQSFTVAFGTQTITFAAIANQPFGTPPFTLSATASSGLPVTFTSPTPAVCEVAGATVTLNGAGACTIGALQAGNSSFAAAPPVSQSFMVTQASQSISFGGLPNQPFGAVMAVGAGTSSGLPVVFTAAPASVCTISGAAVTLVGLGTCTITATQPGDANYAAATPVPQGFMVTQANQTIVLSHLSDQRFGTGPVGVSATVASGLPVALASTTPSVCTVSGGFINLVGVGTCTISAAQPGNPNYAPAPTVTASFMVTPGTQTIAFAALPNQNAGAAPFTVTATATSGLPVAFTSTTPAVCTVTGATVTILKVGVCTIQAGQPGNATYAAAAPVLQSFTVGAAAIGSVLNAASYAGASVSSQGYTVAFGSNLSTGTAQAASTPLPSTLAGTTVTITDSTGATVTALLFYVSPSQINFLVPDGLAPGKATVTVANANTGSCSFATTVAPVSPALFTADASGQGVPAAIAFDSTADGQTQAPPVFSCSGSPNVCVANPIDLGPPSTKVYLVLFGTGIRGRSSLAGVSAAMGGVSLEVDYAGAQNTYPGLDQVNVALDRALIGRGQLVLQLTVDGVAANPVTVFVK